MAGPETTWLQHTHTVPFRDIWRGQCQSPGDRPELVGSHRQEELPATEKGQCDLHTWLSILLKVSKNHLDSY